MSKDSSENQPKHSRVEDQSLKDKESKKLPKSFGGWARVILTTFVIFLLSQFVAAFIIQLLLYIIYGPHTHLLDSSAGAQFFYVLLAESLAAGLTIYIVRRRGLSFSSIGLGRKPNLRDLWRALGGFLAFYAILLAFGFLFTLLFPHVNLDQKQDVGFNGLTSSMDHILAFISLVVIPPLGEETLIRGYLYSGLRSSMRFAPALLITSGLFGLAHLTGGVNSAVIWVAAADTFILSVVLVYLREKTGALYAGILVHMLNNVIAFSVYLSR